MLEVTNGARTTVVELNEVINYEIKLKEMERRRLTNCLRNVKWMKGVVELEIKFSSGFNRPRITKYVLLTARSFSDELRDWQGEFGLIKCSRDY